MRIRLSMRIVLLVLLEFRSRVLKSAGSLFDFFFKDTATTEIYTLSLHDALPISSRWSSTHAPSPPARRPPRSLGSRRSEEHTSELQSHVNLVCRLLLEKKKNLIARLMDQS